MKKKEKKVELKKEEEEDGGRDIRERLYEVCKACFFFFLKKDAY